MTVGQPTPNGSAPPRPTLREAVARLAPGTALRDGLERILRGRTGALIVLGCDDSVE
ncbi:MAG: DNA integrity scanning protein DisA, partial [Mycobacterium sp.]